MMQSDNELLIFARAPRVGSVKTRLAATVGPERACEIYQLLLGTVASSLKGMEHATVCFAPEDGEPDLRRYFPEQWQFRPQRGAHLGLRLEHATHNAFQTGANKVAVIGSDCPALHPDDISDAWQALDAHDLVLGPAEDGGYWLIGMKQPQPALFRAIEWGTGKVLEQTIARAHEARLKVRLLRTLPDIDTAADWEKYGRNAEREGSNRTVENGKKPR